MQKDYKEYHFDAREYFDKRTWTFKKPFDFPLPMSDVLAIEYCTQAGNSHDETFEYNTIYIDPKFSIGAVDSSYCQFHGERENIESESDILKCIEKAVKQCDTWNDSIKIYIREHKFDIECPFCSNKWTFDDTDIPNNTKYELKCNKCGALLMLKKP